MVARDHDAIIVREMLATVSVHRKGHFLYYVENLTDTACFGVQSATHATLLKVAFLHIK